MALQVLGFIAKYTGKITSVGAASQSFAVPEVYKWESASLLITNDTDKTIFVKTAKNAAPTATETGEGVTPVLAGLQAIVGMDNFVAVVALTSATGTVYITPGN